MQNVALDVDVVLDVHVDAVLEIVLVDDVDVVFVVVVFVTIVEVRVIWVRVVVELRSYTLVVLLAREYVVEVALSSVDDVVIDDLVVEDLVIVCVVVV